MYYQHGLAWLPKKSPLKNPLAKVDNQCFYDHSTLLFMEESHLHFHETGLSSTKEAICGNWVAVHTHHNTHLIHPKKRTEPLTLTPITKEFLGY